MLPAGQAFAATINVDSGCTLTNAINEANGETAGVGSCEAGTDGSGATGADTIELSGNITLSAELPQIASTITINGNGRTISGADTHNIFGVRFTTGDLTINNLVLTNGFESQGGAINAQGDVTLNNVVIKNSRSVQEGGAIYMSNSQADLVINRSAFYNNRAGNVGGALMLNGKTHVINNSSFYNNSSFDQSNGGAILLGLNRASATYELNHVTITGNTGGTGGGLGLTFGSLTLRNSIIYGNTAVDINESADSGDCTNTANNVVTQTGNIIGTGNCGAAFSTANPRLSSSATGSPPYYTFREDSPAKDAVACISGITEDQRGTSRPQGSLCDIGAYEGPGYPAPPLLQRQPNEGAPSSSSDEESSAVDDSYTAPPPSTCLTLNGIVASNISESTHCQRVNAMQIAHPAIKDGDFVDAVDVWGWVTPNSEICFEAAGGSFKFIDTAAMPRTVSDLSAYSRQDTICATINGPGILVLLPGDAPPAGSAPAQTASSASRGLSDCMVRLTEKLNFRETPGGEVMQVLAEDMKLTAEARTDDWFKVDFWGKKGWVSADYVVPEGACG